MDTEKKKQGQIKKRSLIGAAILGIVGIILFYENRGYYFIPWILGAYLAVGSLFLPALIKPIDSLIQGLSRIISLILTKIFLTLVYYLMITPAGLYFRITGQDRLDMKFPDDRDSYWHKRPPEKQTPGCEKQY